MMRRFVKCVLGLAIVSSICSCNNEKNEPEELKQFLKMAVESYLAGDIQTYEQCIDYGTEMDSIHLFILRKTYEQRFDQVGNDTVWAVRVDPTTVAYENDTIAYVYYNIVLSDSSRESCSQKMNRVGDEWKLTMRN